MAGSSLHQSPPLSSSELQFTLTFTPPPHHLTSSTITQSDLLSSTLARIRRTLLSSSTLTGFDGLCSKTFTVEEGERVVRLFNKVASRDGGSGRLEASELGEMEKVTFAAAVVPEDESLWRSHRISSAPTTIQLQTPNFLTHGGQEGAVWHGYWYLFQW